MKKYNRTRIFVFLILLGCQTQKDTSSDVEGFPIEDPFLIEEEEDIIYVEDTYPSYSSPEEKKADLNVIIYEPGELEWARSDHRVFFHQNKEILTYNDDDFDYSKKMRVKDTSHDTLSEEKRYVSIIGVRTWHEALKNGIATFPSTIGEREKKELSALPFYYLGFYLPDYLQQSDRPELHLFQCTQGAFASAYDIYKHGDLTIVCGNIFYKSWIYVPVNSDTHKKFECFVSDYQKDLPLGEQLYPNVCSKEHEQSIENVIWFGEDLPYKNTHKNAYSFELSAGQIHKTRPDNGCTAFDYEEEVCERSMNNWSSYIKYY